MKRIMTITVKVDLDKEMYGVTAVKTNTNVDDLRLGKEFMALVFEGLAKEYKQRI